MDASHPPGRQDPPRIDLDAALPALLALRDQMQELHAQLEYLRLMIRLRSRQF